MLFYLISYGIFSISNYKHIYILNKMSCPLVSLVLAQLMTSSFLSDLHWSQIWFTIPAFQSLLPTSLCVLILHSSSRSAVLGLVNERDTLRDHLLTAWSLNSENQTVHGNINYANQSIKNWITKNTFRRLGSNPLPWAWIRQDYFIMLINLVQVDK